MANEGSSVFLCVNWMHLSKQKSGDFERRSVSAGSVSRCEGSWKLKFRVGDAGAGMTVIREQCVFR